MEDCSHITPHLFIENFKCFRNLEIQLLPLTILTGMNGSGKSSVFQSLLMLKQTAETDKTLEGDWINVIDRSDFICFFGTGATSIALSEDQNLVDQKLVKYVVEDANGSEIHTLDSQLVTDYLSSISYICAERLGPRLHNPSPSKKDGFVGINGEFTSAVLARQSDRNISIEIEPINDGKHQNLLEQVSSWMDQISPSARVKAYEVNNIEAAYSTVSFSYETDRTPEFKPPMVGFGISYALPIIVAILTAEVGQTILIENPEAHIHPSGQSALGKLIARAAGAGIRFIVETHSDHLLNGIRIDVKNELLQNELVGVNYFRKSEDGSSECVKIKMGADGTLDQWPDGFFDQAINDLVALS